jgi:hypothetical protein
MPNEGATLRAGVGGRVTFTYADHEEVFEAGDAFYTPPGHTPPGHTPPRHIPVKHQPGTEMLMFGPAEELQKTDAVMMKNMQAMQGG